MSGTILSLSLSITRRGWKKSELLLRKGTSTGNALNNNMLKVEWVICCWKKNLTITNMLQIKMLNTDWQTLAYALVYSIFNKRWSVYFNGGREIQMIRLMIHKYYGLTELAVI